MLIASLVYMAANAAIMVGMLVSRAAVIFVAMLVAIIFYGITYSTVSSIYPSEIGKR